jgi:ABC-type dipeptide/oligopeptide/nickel transport system permease component
MVGASLALVVLISIAPMLIVQWIRGKPLDELEESPVSIILCAPVVWIVIYIILQFIGYEPFK